jgi:hypothetical protein
MPGYFQPNMSAAECVACAVNTFSNTTQSVECIVCPESLNTTDVGSVECVVIEEEIVVASKESSGPDRTYIIVVGALGGLVAVVGGIFYFWPASMYTPLL